MFFALRQIINDTPIRNKRAKEIRSCLAELIPVLVKNRPQAAYRLRFI
jgi:hypothetical protein